MSDDWYFIHTGGQCTMVIGPGCRGGHVAHAARDWVNRGGAVMVSGPDRQEFAGRLLDRLGATHKVVAGADSASLRIE